MAGKPASARATVDVKLTRTIRTIHASSRGTYRVPHVHAELKTEGIDVGKKRVARLIKRLGPSRQPGQEREYDVT